MRLAFREAMLTGHNLLGSGVTQLRVAAPVEIGPADLTVLCLVRNGAAHLPTFLRYYERLGVKHLVFLDNGSTDETLEMLSACPLATVLSSHLPFSRYEEAFKRLMVRRYMGKGWALVADDDELFDYPHSDTLSLPSFLEYLNAAGYDAVTAQNLEMFPRESIAEIQGREIDDLERTHRYYDLSDIRKVRNQYWLHENTFDSEGHFTHTGGVWETIFGYAGSKLTKQPLFRYAPRLNVFPYDPHFVTGGRIADVTGVFRHYKYTGRFIEHVREELRRKQHYGKAEIFEYYRRTLADNPNLSLFRPTALEYKSATDLVPPGFLLASPRFKSWVAQHGDRMVEAASS